MQLPRKEAAAPTSTDMSSANVSAARVSMPQQIQANTKNYQPIKTAGDVYKQEMSQTSTIDRIVNVGGQMLNYYAEFKEADNKMSYEAAKAEYNAQAKITVAELSARATEYNPETDRFYGETLVDDIKKELENVKTIVRDKHRFEGKTHEANWTNFTIGADSSYEAAAIGNEAKFLHARAKDNYESSVISAETLEDAQVAISTAIGAGVETVEGGQEKLANWQLGKQYDGISNNIETMDANGLVNVSNMLESDEWTSRFSSKQLTAMENQIYERALTIQYEKFAARSDGFTTKDDIEAYIAQVAQMSPEQLGLTSILDKGKLINGLGDLTAESKAILDRKKEITATEVKRQDLQNKVAWELAGVEPPDLNVKPDAATRLERERQVVENNPAVVEAGGYIAAGHDGIDAIQQHWDTYKDLPPGYEEEAAMRFMHGGGSEDADERRDVRRQTAEHLNTFLQANPEARRMLDPALQERMNIHQEDELTEQELNSIGGIRVNPKVASYSDEHIAGANQAFNREFPNGVESPEAMDASYKFIHKYGEPPALLTQTITHLSTKPGDAQANLKGAGMLWQLKNDFPQFLLEGSPFDPEVRKQASVVGGTLVRHGDASVTLAKFQNVTPGDYNQNKATWKEQKYGSQDHSKGMTAALDKFPHLKDQIDNPWIPMEDGKVAEMPALMKQQFNQNLEDAFYVTGNMEDAYVLAGAQTFPNWGYEVRDGKPQFVNESIYSVYGTDTPARKGIRQQAKGELATHGISVPEGTEITFPYMGIIQGQKTWAIHVNGSGVTTKNGYLGISGEQRENVFVDANAKKLRYEQEEKEYNRHNDREAAGIALVRDDMLAKAYHNIKTTTDFIGNYRPQQQFLEWAVSIGEMTKEQAINLAGQTPEFNHDGIARADREAYYRKNKAHREETGFTLPMQDFPEDAEVSVRENAFNVKMKQWEADQMEQRERTVDAEGNVHPEYEEERLKERRMDYKRSLEKRGYVDPTGEK